MEHIDELDNLDLDKLNDTDLLRLRHAGKRAEDLLVNRLRPILRKTIKQCTEEGSEDRAVAVSYGIEGIKKAIERGKPEAGDEFFYGFVKKTVRGDILKGLRKESLIAIPHSVFDDVSKILKKVREIYEILDNNRLSEVEKPTKELIKISQ